MQIQASPTLYVVATPIGNLKDITLRALETLNLVDKIICEDTKVSLKLLNHYNIKKPLISFNNFNENTKTESVIQLLKQGNNIALISDAGTPLISDPGFVLVKECYANNINVVSIPGASSIIATASISGIPCTNFVFLGFLDKSASKQAQKLQEVAKINASIIILESPKRLLATLTNIMNLFGSNQLITVAKELTKMHETITHATVSHIINLIKSNAYTLKGEYTLMFLPNANHTVFTQTDITNYIQQNINTLSASALAKQVSKQFSISKNCAYTLITNLKNAT